MGHPSEDDGSRPRGQAEKSNWVAGTTQLGSRNYPTGQPEPPNWVAVTTQLGGSDYPTGQPELPNWKAGTAPADGLYRRILKQYWGYDSFRGIQEDIIRSIGQGRDTLGLMPTGGGKSVAFQVPALAREGLCLVVTPLIALMKDQVLHLRERGIKALAIYSGMGREEIITALENCIFGDYKFLYISPERLATDIFREKLKRMRISMIAVDESHCISQWGYDFRPAYLKIAQVRDLLPGVPVLALTATATPEVVKDIQAQLHFRQENVFRMSFERQNLAYIVRRTNDKAQELLHILRSVPGSAIVYTRNRQRTKEVAQLLAGNGISADYYHAGLDNEAKDQRQHRWHSGETRVIVATNAFGMGIDKADVRLVIHIDLPDSIEAYFQEAGRAGRDGRKAYAVMLYSSSDKAVLKRRVADNFPEKAYIRQVYEHLQYYYQMAMGDGRGCVREFDIDDFCRKFKHFPIQADSALRILTQAGYLEYTEEQDNASRLRFTIQRDELYKLNDMQGDMDKLIRVALRSYTGLFTDYAFIDENLLATRCGLTRNRVYELLVFLAKAHLVSYIPRKKTPYIIYTRERVESNRLNIPRSAYEDRKKRYEQRIDDMLYYAENDIACRSRMLLRYFGERNEHNCGCCDNCLAMRKKSNAIPEPAEPTEEDVLGILKSGPLTMAALMERLGTEASDTVAAIVRDLLEKGAATMENSMLKPAGK